MKLTDTEFLSCAKAQERLQEGCFMIFLFALDPFNTLLVIEVERVRPEKHAIEGYDTKEIDQKHASIWH